jgi:hypothetical protein
MFSTTTEHYLCVISSKSIIQELYSAAVFSSFFFPQLPRTFLASSSCVLHSSSVVSQYFKRNALTSTGNDFILPPSDFVSDTAKLLKKIPSMLFGIFCTGVLRNLYIDSYHVHVLKELSLATAV